VWSREKARAVFADMGESFKVELVDAIPEDQSIRIYRQGDWFDLCRGPHVPHTGHVRAFKLMSVAGAYWRGDEKRDYVVSLPDFSPHKWDPCCLAGIPLPVVQGIVGHMDAEMTKQYMDHAEMEAKERLLKTMPNYLLPEPEECDESLAVLLSDIVQQLNTFDKNELSEVAIYLGKMMNCPQTHKIV